MSIYILELDKLLYIYWNKQYFVLLSYIIYIWWDSMISSSLYIPWDMLSRLFRNHIHKNTWNNTYTIILFNVILEYNGSILL